MESLIDNPDVLNSWYSHEVYRCSRYSHGTTHYWLATKDPEVGDGIYNDAALTDQAGVVETASGQAFVMGGTPYTYDAGFDVYDKITSTTQAPSQSAVLANYAQSSLSNLTTTGNSALGAASSPSSNMTTLTLMSSGSSYTAPANGYYLAKFQSLKGAIGYAFIRASNNAVVVRNDQWHNDAADILSNEVSIYAGKGDTIYISYAHTGMTGTAGLYFVKAKGE